MNLQVDNVRVCTENFALVILNLQNLLNSIMAKFICFDHDSGPVETTPKKQKKFFKKRNSKFIIKQE